VTAPSGNEDKEEHKKLPKNMMKNFFTKRVTEHWNKLLREIVESPFLDILKTCLDAFLCNCYRNLL